MAGGESDQGHGAGEVLMQRVERGSGIGLRDVLVAERAEAKNDAVKTAERACRASDELVMRGEVGGVEGAAQCGHTGANADVLGDAANFVGVARGEIESRAVAGEAQRERACDRAGGAKNENSIHRGRGAQAGSIPSRRERLDEKRLSGSATALAACHLPKFGYIARKVSGDMRASLARYTRPPRLSTIASSESRNSSRPSVTGKSMASV